MTPVFKSLHGVRQNRLFFIDPETNPIFCSCSRFGLPFSETRHFRRCPIAAQEESYPRCSMKYVRMSHEVAQRIIQTEAVIFIPMALSEHKNSSRAGKVYSPFELGRNQVTISEMSYLIFAIQNRKSQSKQQIMRGNDTWRSFTPYLVPSDAR